MVWKQIASSQKVCLIVLSVDKNIFTDFWYMEKHTVGLQKTKSQNYFYWYHLIGTTGISCPSNHIKSKSRTRLMHMVLVNGYDERSLFEHTCTDHAPSSLTPFQLTNKKSLVTWTLPMDQSETNTWPVVILDQSQTDMSESYPCMDNHSDHQTVKCILANSRNFLGIKGWPSAPASGSGRNNLRKAFGTILSFLAMLAETRERRVTKALSALKCLVIQFK